jgi:hypothetical protein
MTQAKQSRTSSHTPSPPNEHPAGRRKPPRTYFITNFNPSARSSRRAFAFLETLMADYFTHFSCLLDVRTSENAARALDLYNNAPENGDGLRLSDGFLLSLNDEGATELWIHDECSGDPERVIEFVLLCATKFDLNGLWGFEYANTCSKPRLDAFGGGAHVIDLSARKSVGWTSTYEWLCRALQGDASDA